MSAVRSVFLRVLGQGARRRLSSAVVLCLGLQACATDSLNRVPASPQQAWQPQVSRYPEQAGGLPSANFSVGTDARVAQLHKGPALQAEHTYTLYELIDIAQTENPATRLAWNSARQAALAQGMIEATFLPMLSARVVSGWGRDRTPVSLPVMGQVDLDSRYDGVIPALALEWLVFDFGQRRALAESAGHMLQAANVLFNASHQKVIRDVTHAYYQYGASKERVSLAEQAHQNIAKVAQAVKARYEGGVGTSVEAALAKQHVAQAKLRQVNAEGLQRTVYQELLAATGLPANSTIQVSRAVDQALADTSEELTQAAIEQALSQRPDLLASYATLEAAQSHVQAAQAEFAPKVFVSAIVAHNRSSLGINDLPDVQRRSYPAAVMVGLNLPLYDSGLRAARLTHAQIQVSKAQDMLQKLQQDAMREMVAMHAVLRTALTAYEAAGELEEATRITYDAALEAYEHGVGTVTLALEAATALLDAQTARSDAHVAALTAAADLAFLMGEMTQAPERPR